MSEVIETVDVAVPLHTAYNQWTQFEEFPRFEGAEEVRQVSDDLTHWKIGDVHDHPQICRIDHAIRG